MRSAALGFIDGRPLTVRLTRRARCRPRQFFPPEPKSTDCGFGHGSWQRVHFHLAGGYPGVTIPDTVTTGPIIGVRSVAVIRVIVRPGRECTANDRTGNDSTRHRRTPAPPSFRRAGGCNCRRTDTYCRDESSQNLPHKVIPDTNKQSPRLLSLRPHWLTPTNTIRVIVVL